MAKTWAEWSESETQELLAGREAGLTYKELARQLDRTPSAITSRLRVLRQTGKLDQATNGSEPAFARQPETIAAVEPGPEPPDAGEEFALVLETALSVDQALRRLGSDDHQRVLAWLNTKF